MTTNAFVNHCAYDFRGSLRDKSMLFTCYAFPIGFCLIMGAIMPSINPYFRDLMTPSMGIFAVQSIAFMALPTPFVTMREMGVFRSFKINGVPALPCVLVPLLAGLPHMIVSGLSVGLLSTFLFKGTAPLSWFIFSGHLLLIGVVLGSLGILIGVISSNARTASIIGQVFYIPSILLGGLMMPASVLPQRFAWVSFLTPGRHTMDVLSGWGMGLPVTTVHGSLLALLGTLVFCILLSLVLFQWDSSTAERGRPRVLGVLALIPFAVTALILGR